ncbi:MAG: FAD-binding oxidoreductase, partial [Paracoccaceae bacterium]|nr:FAD-binding oxidoreductase [Paracoccaceae bacterium]
MTVKYDYLVIGAGISGAAAAYELAQYGSVALIEAETAPGYHSTGRSAALYTPNYGSATVRRINQVSSAFFTDPPAGFCECPLLTPRGLLVIAGPGEEDRLTPILDMSGAGGAIEKITAAHALELAPLLRPERVAAAAYERGVTDIDVSALHQGYLRGVKDRGGVVICGSRIQRLDRSGTYWQAVAGDTVVSGRVIVNAAGAWAGQIGEMAGAAPIGLVPKRRTAIIVDPPSPAMNIDAMPAIDYAVGDAYLKPDAGRIMASPGDQTPVEPQDVRPEEWDIAVLVDWLERETLIPVRRIAHSWAGLRSFVADETPVVGFDSTIPDFFWLAGQGGYGIMMAPALGRVTASLI